MTRIKKLFIFDIGINANKGRAGNSQLKKIVAELSKTVDEL